MYRTFVNIISMTLAMMAALSAKASVPEAVPVEISVDIPDNLELDTTLSDIYLQEGTKGNPPSIYSLPYSTTLNVPDWRRLWTNTAVLGSAYVGALLVLECLPEDATSWNRAELQKTPLFRRWYENVFVKGPEWDHDNKIFNYILHPYAGAVYFMAARSNGFNFYRSLLYATCVSTIGWEFGIEAFMERPSIQDIFITPLIGATIGEGFYRVKRHIVENGYELCGSKVLGNIVAVLVDPINEVVGLVAGNPARRVAEQHIQFAPSPTGFSLTVTF